MTGGQTALSLEAEDVDQRSSENLVAESSIKHENLVVWQAEESDLTSHQEYLKYLEGKAGKCAW